MRTIGRTATLAGLLAIGGLLGFGTSSAKAQYGYGGYGGGYYVSPGYNYGYGGYGYGVPAQVYYGNGGHDFQPHMHSVQTPIGTFGYYGLGAHDFRPHTHVETPYGITGYNGGFFTNTQSYSPPSPYIFRPW